MKTILVIEDTKDVRENLVEILELENFNVLAADDGRPGIELAKKHLPDLVLCDVMMPGMNGFEVFFELNKDLRTAGLPFIFLTAKSEPEDKRYGLQIGADDYMTKPFHSDVLLARIRNRIEKHEQRKQEIADHLTEYVRELENFLHVTSHKIRSPIATNLGLIQLLEKDREDLREEHVRMLSHLRDNMNRLDESCQGITAYLSRAKEVKMQGRLFPSEQK